MPCPGTREPCREGVYELWWCTSCRQGPWVAILCTRKGRQTDRPFTSTNRPRGTMNRTPLSPPLKKHSQTRKWLDTVQSQTQDFSPFKKRQKWQKNTLCRGTQVSNDTRETKCIKTQQFGPKKNNTKLGTKQWHRHWHSRLAETGETKRDSKRMKTKTIRLRLLEEWES